MGGGSPIWRIDQRWERARKTKQMRVDKRLRQEEAATVKRPLSSPCLAEETHNLKSIEIPRNKPLLSHFCLQCSSPAPGSPCTPRRSSSARNLQHRKANHDQTSFLLHSALPPPPLCGIERPWNFRPELFRRGWRHRYFNPAVSGNTARERAPAGG